MAGDFIPVNTPGLSGNEKRYLAECIDTGWISSEGPFVTRFEEGFAAAVDCAHGISVTNGTDALRLAIAALGIGAGDEVIMPSFTIISCASAVTDAGAVPVLVDCDPDTWNMDVSQIEARITERTRAIMAVHIYGLPVDMDPLMALAHKHGLRVIEDAAEAIGLAYRGRPCGGIGDISTFSFYVNKHVTTGEGGMVTTSDPALAEKCRWYRNLCFDKQRFRHTELGWNMRMTNLQAAVGVAQLERLAETAATKRRIGMTYMEAFADLDAVQLPVAGNEAAENAFWVFGMVLDDKVPGDAETVMRAFAERGIGTRPFFWPLHEQQVYLERGLFAGERHPVTERIARRGFYVPSGIGLSAADQERVIATVRDLLG